MRHAAGSRDERGRRAARPTGIVRRVLALAFALASGASVADDAGSPFAVRHPDLPATPQVLAAIDGASIVRIARAGVGVEEAQRQRLAAGPHEFVARAALARRAESGAPTRDAEIGVERGLRFGEKAALDRQLGDKGVEIARLSLVDARHEAGRLLLRLWFAHLRARDERALWTQQVALLQRQLEVVDGRVRAGDAPRAERLLAEAALAQAEQGASQVDARIEVSRAELGAAFPDLPLDALPAIAAPVAPGDDETLWRARMLEHNHEIQVARGETAHARLQAERARAERTPDPTVGVRMLSERSGADRVLGLTLSIPIAGAPREALLRSALAQADQRAEREAAVVRRVGGEALVLFRAARSAFDTWGKADLAARRTAQHAELAARAYALGEGALGDVLLARRAANESRLAALGAQAESQEARYRLVLDAHRLWPFDDEDIEALQAGAPAVPVTR